MRRAPIMFLLVLVPGLLPAALWAETLRIATDASFAPFHFVDSSGQVTGYDVELARAVAEHAGFEVELRVTGYDALFSGLADGSHDLVAATTGITPGRQSRYLFSTPYFETCQAAVVRKGFGEPLSLRELSERRIGAAGDGTSRAAMLGILSAEQIRIKDGEGQKALASRRIDAWIVDEFDAIAAARASHDAFRVLAEPVAMERYGFVMASGDGKRMRRINNSLAELLESGLVDRLRQKFGVRRDAEWPVRFQN
jgi:cystine transport system substrate-binding protein